ncbi:MAG: pyridoxamine 5'-phosphate oxidase [Sphingomonadales bacterium]|nr:MAG: pyridoxamine 5'-phosphate oxidase [Sphingomonadales bacterium]
MSDPFSLFGDWLTEAARSEPNDPNGMALATVGPDGQPSLRMVLLKDWGPDGFVFYTNFESRKGQELQAHPKAALLFHWKSLRRQVRIEGPVSTVSDAEADAYFASRPRDSQIGAWASDQSRPLENRAEFLKRIAVQTAHFGIGPVARPPHWSGFRVHPLAFEFWRDQRFRLHERIVFSRDGDGWREGLLYP